MSKVTRPARNIQAGAESCCCQSRGRNAIVHFSLGKRLARILVTSPIEGEIYSEWIRPDAATMPAIAPLAPREVMKSEFFRTWVVSDANEPSTPDARYRARKLPRPMSSCT